MAQTHSTSGAAGRARSARGPIVLTTGLLVLLAPLLWLGACRSILPPRVPPEPQVQWLPGLPGDVPSQTVFSPDGAGVTLVRGTINGHDSGWLLLDSGSANLLIARRTAKTLHLPVVGEGFAERDIRVSFHLAQQVGLGPLELDKVLVAAASWDRLATLREALGVELAGFAGYQAFANAVVEIRYRAASDPVGRGDRVLLHDPSTYRLPRGSWQPLRTIDRRPTVVVHVTAHRDPAATAPGHADPGASGETPQPSALRALFLVDTGTAGSLILDSRFAREAGLAAADSPTHAKQITLTGAVSVGTTRIPRFALGERAFDDVPATVRTDLFGSRSALAAVDGILGRGLLEGLTVVFDLPHQRIALLDPER